MAQAPALIGGFELPAGPRLPRVGSVDAVALEERAATLAKRSIKRESKLQALDLAIRMMDLPRSARRRFGRTRSTARCRPSPRSACTRTASKTRRSASTAAA
jgi:hypothetical protein